MRGAGHLSRGGELVWSVCGEGVHVWGTDGCLWVWRGVCIHMCLKVWREVCVCRCVKGSACVFVHVRGGRGCEGGWAYMLVWRDVCTYAFMYVHVWGEGCVCICVWRGVYKCLENWGCAHVEEVVQRGA